jgi:autotransporter-associated beta strand protein
MKRKTQSLRTHRHSIPAQFRYFGSPLIVGFFLIQSATAAITTWTGTGGDDNWATLGNWDVALPTGNDAVFGDADATGTKGDGGTPNNIVSANTSVGTVRYTNLETTGYHTTEITAGNTLTIVGGNTASTTATANPGLYVYSPTNNLNDIVYATILGDGNLFVNNAGTNIHVGQGSSAASSATRRATLDMAGLNQFQATVGRIIIGQQTVVGNRPAGTILLAKTNIIDLTNTTAPGLLLGDAGSNNGVSQIIELGTTNTILTDFGITVGGRKGNGIIRYNSSSVDEGAGTVTFRSRNGTGRQGQWRIGDNSGQGGGGTLATGIVDFSLYGAVDALVDAMTLGRGTGYLSTTAVTNANPSQGTLTFDKGTVNVNQLTLGIQPVIDAGGGQGTLNVDGTGNLTVNGTLTLGRLFGTTTATVHKALGLLNIGTISGGGSVTISGDVICGTGVGNKITLTAGSLALGGKVGDDSVDGDAALETLQLNGGTLQFNFGATPNPTGSRVKVAALNVPNSVTIGITGASLSPGTIELIKYATFDQATQFANLTLGLPARVVANLVNNTANSSVDLEIISVSTNKWSGAVNSDWDIDTTLNWALSPGNTPSKYLQAGIPGEAVTFDDTASGTKTVNLTTTLSPGAITVDTASSYTFNGTGAISGPTGITKRGSGSLVIESSGVNNFTGAINIEAGRIQTAGGNDRLPLETTVTLADVATAELDLNNSNQTLLSLNGGGATGGNLKLGSGALTLTGAGSYAGVISGSGILTKSGAGTQVLSGANLYSGGTTISGGRLAVANPSGSGLGSGPVVIDTAGVLAIGAGEAPGSITASTITNNGRVAFNSNEDFTFSNLLEGIGVVAKENTANTVTLASANPYSGFTTITGGGLRVTHKDSLGTFVADPLNPTVGFNTNISNDPSSRLELEGGITLQEPLTVATKGGAVTSPAVLNVSGDNILAGPIELTTGGSVWNFQSDVGKLTITGTMTNIATLNTRTIRLAGEAIGEIQSNLANSNGNLSLTAVAKEGTGTWTLAGDNTNTGPTAVNGGTLLITGTHTTSATTVAFGSTLGGTGTLGTINSLGAIAPGVGIGTLNAGETTLNGVLEIEVSGASSDLLNVTGTLALNASTVNITGTPVAASYILATATTDITGTPTLETEIPGYELVIDGTSLKLNSTSPGTPFTTWAGLNNLAGNDALPETDVENDGLENLLEFVLGGNPKANDTPSVRPAIVNAANSITLTFKRSDASELQPVAVRVQVSADLATWNPADEITIGASGGTGPNGATYTVDETGDFDTIVVTIPKNSASTKFARVKAVIP